MTSRDAGRGDPAAVVDLARSDRESIEPAPCDVVGFEGFRKIVGSFPTGVTLVTTLHADGTPRGVTVNAFSSVSADPPILLICLNHKSRTRAAIVEHNAFVVHVLGDAAQGLSRRFSSRQASFAGLGWAPSTVARGAPVLRDHTIAGAECHLERTVDVGDHTILFGLVAGGWGREGPPLLYHRGSYHGWSPGSRLRQAEAAC